MYAHFQLHVGVGIIVETRVPFLLQANTVFASQEISVSKDLPRTCLVCHVKTWHDPTAIIGGNPLQHLTLCACMMSCFLPRHFLASSFDSKVGICIAPKMGHKVLVSIPKVQLHSYM